MFNSKYFFNKTDPIMTEELTHFLPKEEFFKSNMLLKRLRCLFFKLAGVISCWNQSSWRCDSCSGKETQFYSHCARKYLKDFRN